MSDKRKLSFEDNGKFYHDNGLHTSIITDVSEEEFIALLEAEFRTMHYDIANISRAARDAESHKRDMLLHFAHWKMAVDADIRNSIEQETLAVAYKLWPERMGSHSTAFSSGEWTIASRARKAGARGD